MKPLTLRDDLIRDFQDQKQTIIEQLALIDPMAESLRTPAARRLLNSGFLVFMELVSWIMLLGCVALVILMDRLYPFHLLNKLLHDTAIADNYRPQDVRMLQWTVKGIILFVALLFFIIARMLPVIRHKNSVLYVAGRNMKLLVEQLLKRKAAMDTLEQKHPIEMPSNSDTVVMPTQKPHNDILL